MAITIRTGGTSDAEAVLALWRAADAAPSVTDDAEALSVLLARDSGALLLAEDDGRLVGTLIAGFDGWRGGMYRLAVLPEARRRGIARGLVAEGERRLRVAGVRRMTALVVADEVPAVEFWRAAGYVLDERIARYVKTL